MSAIDIIVARRHFAARYANVGRAMLGQLAAIYGIDADMARSWAEDIDRQNQETPQQDLITADTGGGCEGRDASGMGVNGGCCGGVTPPNPANAIPTRHAGGDNHGMVA